jgi:hypothetical protein
MFQEKFHLCEFCNNCHWDAAAKRRVFDTCIKSEIIESLEIRAFFSAPGMGDNLAVKVRYALGSVIRQNK